MSQISDADMKKLTNLSKEKLFNDVIFPLKNKMRTLRQELRQLKEERENSLTQMQEIEDRKNMLDAREELMKAERDRLDKDKAMMRKEHFDMCYEWNKINQAKIMFGIADDDEEDDTKTDTKTVVEMETEPIQEPTVNLVNTCKTKQQEGSALEKDKINEAKTDVPNEPQKKKRGRKPKNVEKEDDETPAKKIKVESTVSGEQPTRKSPRLSNNHQASSVASRSRTPAKTTDDCSVENIQLPDLDMNTMITDDGYYLQSKEEMESVKQWRILFLQMIIKGVRSCDKTYSCNEFNEDLVLSFYKKFSNFILKKTVEIEGSVNNIGNDINHHGKHIIHNIILFFFVKKHVSKVVNKINKLTDEAKKQELIRNLTDDFLHRIIDSYTHTNTQDPFLAKIELTDDNKLMISQECERYFESYLTFIK